MTPTQQPYTYSDGERRHCNRNNGHTICDDCVIALYTHLHTSTPQKGYPSTATLL